MVMIDKLFENVTMSKRELWFWALAFLSIPSIWLGVWVAVGMIVD